MIKNCNNCKFFHDPLKTGARYVCGAVDKRDCKHALNAFSGWQPLRKHKKPNWLCTQSGTGAEAFRGRRDYVVN